MPIYALHPTQVVKPLSNTHTFVVSGAAPADMSVHVSIPDPPAADLKVKLSLGGGGTSAAMAAAGAAGDDVCKGIASLNLTADEWATSGVQLTPGSELSLTAADEFALEITSNTPCSLHDKGGGNHCYDKVRQDMTDTTDGIIRQRHRFGASAAAGGGITVWQFISCDNSFKSSC